MTDETCVGCGEKACECLGTYDRCADEVEETGKTGSPFCDNCKEEQCEISTDGTCSMIVKYLEAIS